MLRTGLKKEAPTASTSNQCKLCGNTLVVNMKENNLYCGGCGAVQGVGAPVVSYQNRSHYGNFSLIHQYKRLTRFREVLRQIQGLGEGRIPSTVINVLQQEVDKYSRHICVADPHFIRAALRRRRLGTWCEHAVRLAVLHGFRALLVPSRLYGVLERMFLSCDKIWNVIKEQVKRDLQWTRYNFPSYVNLLYNFFLLLGEKTLALYVKPLLLKSTALYHRQQVYWRYFCVNLNWNFTRVQGCLFSRRKHLSTIPVKSLPVRWHPEKSKERYLSDRMGSVSSGKRTILGFMRRLTANFRSLPKTNRDYLSKSRKRSIPAHCLMTSGPRQSLDSFRL